MTTKEQVLRYLAAHRGQTVSGAEMAARLAVSRTAVWKAAGELRAEGYAIEATTKNGYRLTESNDVLVAEVIESLAPGAHVRYYPEVESTNLTARILAEQGAVHGTVVIAERQTAGRGRLDRSFYSPPGTGVYISFILRPRLTSEQSLLITAGAAVAVCRAVEEVAGVNCGIKWVNDVYVGDRKICGILTEGVTDFETGAVQYVVLGIGVNLFPPREGFPDEVAGRAGAVTEDRSVTRNELAAAVIREVLRLNVLSGDFMEEYRERSLVLGKRIRVIGLTESYEAVAVSVTAEGYLVVELAGGERRTVTSGEVSVRWAE